MRADVKYAFWVIVVGTLSAWSSVEGALGLDENTHAPHIARS